MCAVASSSAQGQKKRAGHVTGTRAGQDQDEEEDIGRESRQVNGLW